VLKKGFVFFFCKLPAKFFRLYESARAKKKPPEQFLELGMVSARSKLPSLGVKQLEIVKRSNLLPINLQRK
jgi:hypothetical protein